MKVYNLFSKRNKLKSISVDQVLDINHFPQKLKNQVIHILNDYFEANSKHTGGVEQYNIYREVVKILNHEYGISITNGNQLIKIFLECKDIYFLYDFIELMFGFIEKLKVPKKRQTTKDRDAVFGAAIINALYSDSNELIDESIDELNTRFKENGIGFRYKSGKIIRITDEYTYSEITLPALNLLGSELYEGANAEFLSAFEHYKYGRNKECLNECLKSFESVMKCICEKRKWKFNSQKDTSSKLIEICFAHNLIPDYLQSQFTCLKSLLTSGIPTIRNRESGHGQGKNIKMVDDYIAGYALNLAATNILLLINADRLYK